MNIPTIAQSHEFKLALAREILLALGNAHHALSNEEIQQIKDKIPAQDAATSSQEGRS